nr:photosystem I assembly protein Ycf3 [Dryopteris crassirhizoma]
MTPRSQRNDNFIDKTFTILADISSQILPTTKREREASTYYRDGAIRMSAQPEGEYAEALITTHSDRGEQAINQGNLEISEAWFDQAAEYWKQAIAPSPDNYTEAQNRLKITGRSSSFN